MSKLLQLLILGIWIGLVIGLSFIEAPLKFQAPDMTTKLGLGIGQLVFGVLNKIEILFTIALIPLYFGISKQLGNLLMSTLIVLALIVFIQSVFLLPALNARVNLILAGEIVAPSKHHIFFILLEITKVIALFIAFIKTYQLTLNF